jgi:hypothetical protein
MFKSFLALALVLTSFLTVSAAEPSVSISEQADQVVLTINHSYLSTLSRDDINHVLNPNNGRIQDLFRDRMEISGGPRRFDVETEVNVTLVNMDFKCILTYTSTATRHTYAFTDFNHLFKSTTINANLVTEGQRIRLNLTQTSIMKKDSYQKIKNVPMGVRTFRNRIVSNIKRFQRNTGGGN